MAAEVQGDSADQQVRGPVDVSCSAMDAEAFVELPHTQENWANLKSGLTELAEKKVKGLDAFEEFLSKNDRWESLGTPFSLLRKVLSDGKHFTEEFFCETLLPWIAGEALRVEELFKDKNRLPVSG